MAAGTRVIFEYLNAAGNTVRHSFNYGNAEATAAAVKLHMQTVIANNTIYRNPPVSIKAARAEVTTSSEWDLSD